MVYIIQVYFVSNIIQNTYYFYVKFIIIIITVELFYYLIKIRHSNNIMFRTETLS